MKAVDQRIDQQDPGFVRPGGRVAPMESGERVDRPSCVGIVSSNALRIDALSREPAAIFSWTVTRLSGRDAEDPVAHRALYFVLVRQNEGPASLIETNAHAIAELDVPKPLRVRVVQPSEQSRG